MQPLDETMLSEITPWEIWHDDIFDRDVPNTLDESGVGLINGLVALWRRTLHEGVLEDGRRTFSKFDLIWNKNTQNRGSAHIPMPFTESTQRIFARLRFWGFPLYEKGEALPGDSWKDSCQTAPHKRNDALLHALAEFHLALIRKGDKTVADTASRDDPAALLLTLVATLDDWRDITPELAQ